MRCAGFVSVTAPTGASISSKEAYAMLQNTLPHAAFSASTSPWRASHQRRKPATAASEYDRIVSWQPYSLSVCHATTPGCSPKRSASAVTMRAHSSRYGTYEKQ